MDISEGAGPGGEEEDDEFEMMDDGFDFGDEALGESSGLGVGAGCLPFGILILLSCCWGTF
jgi:hypothetical protein